MSEEIRRELEQLGDVLDKEEHGLRRNQEKLKNIVEHILKPVLKEASEDAVSLGFKSKFGKGLYENSMKLTIQPKPETDKRVFEILVYGAATPDKIVLKQSESEIITEVRDADTEEKIKNVLIMFVAGQIRELVAALRTA